MVGTIVAATFAIRVMPPIITRANNTDSTLAVTIGSRANVLSRPAAILLICGRLPVPNELNTVAIANRIANHFALRPFSM